MTTYSRKQLYDILGDAKDCIRLIGVVALDADWENLIEKWMPKLQKLDFGLRIKVLCESDNMLFSKSFTCDTDKAAKRRSFQELKFIRDRATVVFPELVREFLRRKGETLDKYSQSIQLQIMHLPIPISVVEVDNRIFVNLWLHEVEDEFEEITEKHSWRHILENYIETYFDPERGRKYACDPADEVLELFDHDRIPRGIYPRSSFYDTDYSQLVVWAFIFDRHGQLLIHRRADNAKDNRGMWDKSAGGHIDFLVDVDTSRAIIREVIEELFSEESKKADITPWAVSDKDVVYLGEWRPKKRGLHPFSEIRTLEKEWAFFRLRDSQQLYSPRTLPDGRVRRLRVISDVFLFVAGPQLNDASLGDLRNSQFKLVELSELKNVMDRAIRGENAPSFDKFKLKPDFTPDLTNVMTSKLRDTLEEFSQHIKRYVR